MDVRAPVASSCSFPMAFRPLGSFSVRPVVSLKSEIPAGGDILVSDEEFSGGGVE